MFSLTFAVAAPLVGAATGRWRRDVALLAGIGVFVAGNIATAIAPTFPLALAARVVTALGACLMTPSASALTVALVAPERRGRALAMVMGGLMAASALGVPLGLVVGRTSWRHTLWALAGLGLLAGLAVAVRVPPVRTPAPPLPQRLRPLGNPRVLLVAATSVLALTANFSIFTYASALTRGSGGSLLAVLTAFGVASVVGNVVAGQVADRLGGAYATLTSVGGMVLTLLLLPPSLSAGPGWTLVVFAANGFFGGMLTVPQQHRVVAVDPASAPVLIALLSSAVYVGFSGAALFGGAVIDRLGAGGLPWAAAGLMLVPVALTLLAPDLRREGSVSAA